MNAQAIIANFRQFPRADLEGWGSVLGNVLQALFEEPLRVGRRAGLEDHIDRTRVAVYTIFNHDHQSDESCELRVLSYDDKPVGLAHRSGDTDDFSARVLDEATYKEVATLLAKSLLDEELKNVTAEPLPSLQSLQNSYLYFVGEKESVYAFRNPKWACGFGLVAPGCRTFHVTEAGAVHEVTTIGRFVNDKHHTSDRDEQDIVVTIDGEPRVVDATQLLFEIGPNLADLNDVLVSLPKSPRWLVEAAYEKRLEVSVLSQAAYRWTATSHYVRFETATEFKRFTETFFGHNREDMQEGEFSLEALGYRAQVSTF